ncbi:MAG: hypothetical protein GW906_03920 [Epsilonproteobacteria bacterium]|nr:hypothetical protein [Campylobacterota bacterium]OIO17147.1 MAG: hypothetical protein AUJ81_02660 [Helicobacteraceae bacterium CG1_02_36_14]PIP10118.1 MAG: hypothetical protein COX50_06480 [Sulfurimonas sp. CG23_combo_of_CG06-09_8_20_14_all_36_33]PIS26563.1 MAG: hypothetical protein COT46_02980 [Sulfurimonas sp. CG08_land_8_20_14_0_20_36_33]PIU34024.1 MAG: hypothetical protein COT05_10385 [Sulfurimonas sp. CG07_land_8_20_14_0_80_36_56]PIV03852.1 MAG: hypothetical protein COS56_07610 [Sulfur
MLENVITDSKFASIMQNHIQELVIHFFNQEQNFGILCKIEDVSFEPPLPASINSEFRALTLFFLAGYTFETAQISEDMLIFEAGFGIENHGSLVRVPLLSIMQIIVDETPIFINLSTTKRAKMRVESEDKKGVENSMASFLSNPENSKFVKKK